MIHVHLTKDSSTRLCQCRGVFVLVLSLIFFSCASNHAVVPDASYAERSESLYIPREVTWQPLEGCTWASYFFFENTDYPVRYHCVKIELSSSAVQLVTFPRSEDDFTHKQGVATTYFHGLTAKQFAKRTGALISVNTAPFNGKNRRWKLIAKILSTRTICGIHIVEGTQLSSPRAPYSALCFKKTGEGYEGAIVKNQGTADFSLYDFAFGGFYTILSDSEKASFARQSNDSRTAAGLSADGETLYLLVVEGERRHRSHGLSYPECADIMLALGATDALQMDGGDSSSLFINGKNALSYPALRKNAVFLGFKKLSF